jgi:hypothetical protein
MTEISMTETKDRYFFSNKNSSIRFGHQTLSLCFPRFKHSNIEISDFVSDFDIRISNFPDAPGTLLSGKTFQSPRLYW